MSKRRRVELMAQYGPTLTAEIDRLLAAQHEATRKAFALEILATWDPTNPEKLHRILTEVSR